MTISPNGKVLALQGNNVIGVWRGATAEQLAFWNLPAGVGCVAFARDNKHLAVGKTDGTVQILRSAEAALESLN